MRTGTYVLACGGSLDDLRAQFERHMRQGLETTRPAIGGRLTA